MRGEPPRVRLTAQASKELRTDEALVFDWVRVAMCCAAAGEVALRRTTTREIARAGTFVPLAPAGGLPVFAHRLAYSMLAEQDILIDCRRVLGMRRFTHDLPADFGLRAVLGRVPAPTTR